MMRFSSAQLPERDRVPFFCDFIARKIGRLEIDPFSECPFHVDMASRRLTGLEIVTMRRSPLRLSRTKELVSDGDNRLVLQVDDSEFVVSRSGREVAVGAADAAFCSASDVATINLTRPGGRTTVLLLRNEALAPLLRGGESCIGRTVPASTPALRLLRNYLKLLDDGESGATPELEHLTVQHICDLVALTVGATRDAAHVAKDRGVRAAHLRAIKKDILARLDGALSIDSVAAHRRLSPRYVQRLFEDEGTTFTEFVNEQRLHHARRLLTGPASCQGPISEIAYDVGFSNLSYFNRLFRRRFGMSPTDARKVRDDG
jgi:AraC-like DNA-binding protein